MSQDQALIVVAAVMECDGKILIGQRKRTGRHPLKWEFPGGKVEAGEDPREALRRELREELAIDAEIGEEMDRYSVRYGESAPILLLFYRVVSFSNNPRNMDFEHIVWELRNRLPDYDFLEGDVPFVRKLAAPDANRSGV